MQDYLSKNIGQIFSVQSDIYQLSRDYSSRAHGALLLENIRLGCKAMLGTNTLAYLSKV
jgi:hypothetical protein